MKKTFAILALSTGLFATAQAKITETWTSADLMAAGGTLTVPTSSTTGNQWGDFHITAYLDIEALNTRFTDDDWGVIFGFHDSATSDKGYALTMNQLQNATAGQFYAEKTDNGSFTSLDDNAIIFYPGDTPMETYLSSGNYEHLAFTFGLDSTGLYGWMTVVDSEGNETQAGGKIKGDWKWQGFGNLGSITYDTDVVKFITVNDAYNSDAYADNAAAIDVMSVPEPTTATLSLLALAGLAARRRRK